MPSFKWKHNTNENIHYWDKFVDLLALVESTDGPIVNEDWLNLELTVIGGANLSAKFIQVIKSDVMYHNNGNSSLLYFMGKTDTPPSGPPKNLRYSEGRKTAPDIDLDFDDRYREEVVEYCKSKYGKDHVANIVTFSEVKAASAIRDTARILEYDYDVGDKLTKMIPDAVLGYTKTLKECLEVEEFRHEYENNPDAKKIIDTAIGVEGVYRQTGIHAAGVVITSEPLTDYVPVMQKGDDGLLATQWTMGWIESNGLLKIDFLGLRNLQVIDLCVQNVKERRGIEIDLDSIDKKDPLVFDNLRKGNSNACFQIESQGMKEMMVHLQPEDEFDITALISLYRPGPMGSGMDKMYINRKLGLTPIQYPHECLENVLKKSKGIMIYQEDVLNVAKTAAGMNPAQADNLRRAMGKKQIDKIAEYREDFVKGCYETNKIPAQVANKIYSDIEFFAGYGFNLCLTGDTRIADNSGDSISIDEISKRLNEGEDVELMSYDIDSEAPVIDYCDSVVESGVQDVYEIVFDDGHVVTATLDHKFLCSHNMKYYSLSDIIHNDYDIVAIDL